MRILIILLLMCGICYAEENEKYSYQAYPYHGLSFKDVKAEEFNNSTVIGSCFYQEWLEGEGVVKDIFPDGMTGVVFEKCNLDNIYIPSGNIVKGGCNRKIKIQNDLEDWILDNSLNPKEPMDKEQRVLKNKSIDPLDIPNKKITQYEREQFLKEFDDAEITPIN